MVGGFPYLGSILQYGSDLGFPHEESSPSVDFAIGEHPSDGGLACGCFRDGVVGVLAPRQVRGDDHAEVLVFVDNLDEFPPEPEAFLVESSLGRDVPTSDDHHFALTEVQYHMPFSAVLFHKSIILK